jgi:hypothetical protein
LMSSRLSYRQTASSRWRLGPLRCRDALPFSEQPRYNAFKSWATSAADWPITAGETSRKLRPYGAIPLYGLFLFGSPWRVVTRGLSKAPDDVCPSDRGLCIGKGIPHARRDASDHVDPTLRQ